MAPEQPLPDARLVDLFAGPGGLDVAATWLGIHSVGVEWDDDACETRRAAGLRTKQADVRDLGPLDFPAASILAAGPPCQSFTVAGSGKGRRALQQVVETMEQMDLGLDIGDALRALDAEDPRTGLVLQPLRWILEAEAAERPYDAVLLEQVPAVLPLWKELATLLQRHDYFTAVGVLRAEEFGVPQTRRRAFLLAHREHQPALPDPTHRVFRKGVARDAGDPALLPWVTLGETVKRTGDFAVISNYGTGGDPTARGERFPYEPAATITGKVDRTRLRGSRITETTSRLELEEASQLQTFPPDYPWSDRRTSQQIGNAIPPRLGAHALAALLGKVLPDGLLDNLVGADWSANVQEVRLEDVPPRSVMASVGQEPEPALFNL